MFRFRILVRKIKMNKVNLLVLDFFKKEENWKIG